MAKNLILDKWKLLALKGYKIYFWTCFPFLFIPLSIIFFTQNELPIDYRFSEWEDYGAFLFFLLVPVAVSAFFLSLSWRWAARLKNRSKDDRLT
ncbi:hypothetical protein QWY14_00120 [Planococcus sp. N028]|uniref:Uncharacterized protein n=1 Tax=Planococcus shixiaomingii TaxID=3058393 RepID=A0ABT8MWZ0_9BACL|nr:MULTISPECIES: hypothetical protein [unclassified Planococcus (in: firmicutes)]MDN7240166.1 hypothetical protein [Planococcus sp. N028]WKA56071.1 hypothetical protein QWY21_06930 [Planococcus sp. N022]